MNSHHQIVSYNNNWATDYESEKERLLELFGTGVINIEHIGSTSIKGLQAKSIIDIVIVMKDFEPVDKFDRLLKAAGYVFHSSSTERHFFRKGDPIKYHLSIAFADRGGFWVRQILFRDYLSSHIEARQEYGHLKEKLLAEDPSGLNSYLSGKTDFVNKILKLSGWKENQLYSDYISRQHSE